LGSVALHQRRFEEAARHYGQVVALGEAASLRPGTLGEARWGRAQASWGLGRRTEAIAEARAAAADLESEGAGAANELADVEAWLRTKTKSR
jgi:hypothetical protein